MRLPTIVGVAGGLVLTLVAPAGAQLAGSHTLGDYDVQAGSQPGPGFYDIVFYYRDATHTIKDVDGNGNKKDTSTRVGQILTQEGGVGKSFMGCGASVGIAYYAEWKITKDQLGEFVLPGGTPIDVEFPDKHKVWAFGPDVTLPIATASKLFALVNVRYLWETGARVKTQGETLVVTATLPIPSTKLK